MNHEEKVLSSLNKIRDNLWIGDYAAVQNIAKEVINDSKSSKILEFGEKGIKLVKNIRKDAPKNNQRREWIADNVKNYFKKEEIPIDKYMIGLILQRLKDLPEQEEEDIIENTGLIVHKKYKYRIITRYPKYEIRAIFQEKTKIISDVELYALDELFSVNHSIETTKSSSILRLFSKDVFIESIILPYVGWIKLVSRTEIKKDIETISNTIFTKFSE